MLPKTVGELKKFLENIPDDTPIAVITKGYYSIRRIVGNGQNVSFDYGECYVHTQIMKATDEPILKRVVTINM